MNEIDYVRGCRQTIQRFDCPPAAADDGCDQTNDKLQTANQLTGLNCSTPIAAIFLDRELRVKSFTPAITNIFRLNETDRGRPIGEIISRLDCDDLQGDVRSVLASRSVIEHEVQIPGVAATFIMRIQPYNRVDCGIDGVAITVVDVTERRRTEAAVREHAAIVEFAQEALIGVGLDSMVCSWNPAAARLFGHPANQAIGQPISLLLSSEQAVLQTILVDRALKGEAVAPFEMIYRRQDGAELNVELMAVPIRNEEGEVVALAATARDISERKRADASSSLLLHELSHRVKNALASVQSLALETLRTAPTLDAFRNAFVERLWALANTHDLLSSSDWHGAMLGDVIEAELAPYKSEGAARWTASGPTIQLSPKMALALGMAFHELASNAAKFGALSTSAGHIDVNWHSQEVDAGRRLCLSWIESGGPTVAKPIHQGFGSRLIAHGLALELDGDVQVDYLPAGVRCAVNAPLGAILGVA